MQTISALLEIHTAFTSRLVALINEAWDTMSPDLLVHSQTLSFLQESRKVLKKSNKNNFLIKQR